MTAREVSGAALPAGTRVPADAEIAGMVNCAEEEIRIPGSVQQHGFLLVLDEADERVIAASANAERFLGIPVKLVVGAALDTLFEREVLGAVRSLAVTPELIAPVTYMGAFRVLGELCSLVTHRVGERRVLEFEQLERLVGPEIMNAVITNFVSMLTGVADELALCQSITRRIKDLTGFDRVLLYSFDEAGHGTVKAEENSGALPSYLGLRFPASDIPAQARQLYVLNTMRIIPDANYTPSPLLGMAGADMGAFDLSMSVLRSVSPVHLEYMRNMGTMSSMSVSIVVDGKLWGLISGHHATPWTVPYLVRSACDLLTKMVGTQILSLRTAERLRKTVHFHAVQRLMLTQMAAEKSYLAAMTARMGDLMQVTDASGAAIVVDGVVYLAGGTPAEEELLRLVEWLDGQPGRELFETNELSAELEWGGALAGDASGLLAIRISDVRQRYILWFRPEVAGAVVWAGEPVKVADESRQLHPRRSFESWREIVRGQSAVWTQTEIESAWQFRSAVMTISLRRAEEAAELSEARFQQLTHALPALVWTADDEGNLTYVNERWRELNMAARGCWYEVSGLSTEDEQRIKALWRRSVENGDGFEEEVRVRTKGGGERWHVVRAAPFRTVAGERAGWVGTFTDTTDRRQREAALRMTEKLATTGRMTSVIAHEINNPLESMTNLMYLLRGEVDGDGPAQEYIALVESELERISGITKQTLRWGRENSDEREDTTAGELFDDVLRLFAGKIRNRQVTAEVRSGREVRFNAVAGQMRQVLANLLSNAVDAAPVGGAVWLRARDGEGGVEMEVGDNGAGISAEARGQLFQPFFSTKGDLGNGLGLYISQEIVERHHGKLVVDTDAGSGTVMRVVLPQGAGAARRVESL